MHPVNAALLARGGGRFRCGKCRKVGNALEALFDTWPDPGAEAPKAGDLPELGTPLELEPLAEPSGDEPEESEATAATADRTGKRLLRMVWVTAAVVVLVITGLNLARYFDVPLFDHPAVETALREAGLREAPPPAPFRDREQIEIVSREMVAHPNRPGVLLLDATIINRADRPQPWPDIVIELMDIEGEIVSAQRFAPGDYLSRTTQMRDGMTPRAYVGLSLELDDPGTEAVGFEIEFH